MLRRQEIRVFLLDGQRPSLGDLAAALTEAGDMRVMGGVPRTQDGLTLLTAAQPDVLLVALSGLDHGVAQMLRTARHQIPEMAVVGVGPEDDVPYIYLAASIGAAACVFSDTASGYVAGVIRRVYQGECPIRYDLLSQSRAASRLEAWLQSPEVAMAPDLAPPISARELQMLQEVARGKANKQIAGDLGISEQTVKNHITSILRKSGAHDRAHAVVLALRHGWLSIE